MSEIKDYAIKCFQDEAQAILDLIPLLTDDFENPVIVVQRLQLLWPVLEHLPFLLILWMLFMVIWA